MSAVDPEVLAGPTLDDVDLVAVDRVRAGVPTSLSKAEVDYLFDRMSGDPTERALIARGLGWSREKVRQKYYRRRRRRAHPS